MKANTSERRPGKRRIFDIIQLGNVSDVPSRLFDYILVAAIVVNILAMFLETFGELSRFRRIFDAVEWGTIALFCVEYALRIWTAEYLYPDRSRAGAAGRFLISFDGVVELLTILPFFFLSGAVAFRMLRVVRIFRLFRINANYDSFNVITAVLKDKRNQIASSLFIVLMLMLGSSLCMYSVEHEAQPDKFANALSGMWWSVSALLTVGYGDVYPVTVLGRVMAVFISFLGVGAVAIPTGIISAGFVEQYTRIQNQGGPLSERTRVLTVREDSGWIGLTAAQVGERAGGSVILVGRDGAGIRPGDDFVIRLHDTLCLYRPGASQTAEKRTDGGQNA